MTSIGHKMSYQKKNKICMEAITYIRGRSISNSIILLEECQNLTKEEVKTILSRVSQNSRIFLTGDIDQIDTGGLNAMDNGLSYIVEKFQNCDFIGHMTFEKGERSRLATLASEIL